MNLFEKKGIKPMLIGLQKEAFDSDEHIFELKLDGIRCIAYLDENGVDLRNKRNIRLIDKTPELDQIHRQVKGRCILDGELAVIRDGRTDFSEIQKRVMMTNSSKIRLASQRCPVCFTAFDILFYEDKETISLPLMERKELLTSIVASENEHFAVSRFIEQRGREFFAMTGERGLEGIVAKKKDSRYYFDKRTKDWIKIKNMEDDDFIICGYICKSNNVVSLVLGQYDKAHLIYKGHVTLGVSVNEIIQIMKLKCDQNPFSDIPKGNEKVQWIQPKLVCTVEYMTGTENGGLRQPVFKGLRNDKLALECQKN